MFPGEKEDEVPTNIVLALAAAPPPQLRLKDITPSCLWNSEQFLALIKHRAPPSLLEASTSPSSLCPALLILASKVNIRCWKIFLS